MNISDIFDSFLSLSSISGLNHISLSRGVPRFFWILVVITAFIFSGFLIQQAFEGWTKNPIITTIETLPISELKFPKITVCPPKDTSTNLNHVLEILENRTIDEDTRQDLADFATELLNDAEFDEILANLSIFHEENRFENWYHGRTNVFLPMNNLFGYFGYLSFMLKTHAASGSIRTGNFGENYSPEKVERNLYFPIEIIFPDEIEQENTKLLFQMERNPLKTLANGEENWFSNYLFFDETKQNISKSIDVNDKIGLTVTLDRKVTLSELERNEMDEMPGFSLEWNYDNLINTSTIIDLADDLNIDFFWKNFFLRQ